MGNRLEWIDNMKGFAIIAVVFAHCVNGALHSNMFVDNYEQLVMFSDMGAFYRMPLFFSISGFLFYLTKSYTKYKPKVIDMALMYIIWSIIMWTIKYFAGNSVNYPVTPKMLITNLYSPQFIYWYLYSLILMYLFYSMSAIKQINEKILLILALVACSVNIFKPDWGIVSKTMYFMHFFALGGTGLITITIKI